MKSKLLTFLILFKVISKASFETLEPDDPLLVHLIDEIEDIKSEIEDFNSLRSKNLSYAIKKLDAMIEDIEKRYRGKVNLTLTTEISQVLKSYTANFPTKSTSNNISSDFKYIFKKIQTAFNATIKQLHRFEALNEYGTKDYFFTLYRNKEQLLATFGKKPAFLKTYRYIKKYYRLRNKIEHEVISYLFKSEAILATLTEETKAAYKIYRAAVKKGEIPPEVWLGDWQIIKREVQNLDHQDVSLYRIYLHSLYVDFRLMRIIHKKANIIDPALSKVHLRVALNGEDMKFPEIIK